VNCGMLGTTTFAVLVTVVTSACSHDDGLREQWAAGLTGTQRQLGYDVLRAHKCPCSCGMTVIACATSDPKCSISRGVVAVVRNLVQNRKSRDQIESVLSEQEHSRDLLSEHAVDFSASRDTYVRGPGSARVTIVEFADFECPYCASAERDIAKVLKRFPKDVRLVFRQYPLAFHMHSELAAEATMAAGAQGKFWEMHDALLLHHEMLSRDNILRWGTELGLNIDRLRTELDDKRYEGLVRQERADGTAAGVKGTPTFFINGRRLEGAFAASTVNILVSQALGNS